MVFRHTVTGAGFGRKQCEAGAGEKGTRRERAKFLNFLRVRGGSKKRLQTVQGSDNGGARHACNFWRLRFTPVVVFTPFCEFRRFNASFPRN